MEYHFTGTGASPDFTFIADAIVDSVGNRIFYSTIKKTKIKVKSNTAVLLITTVVEGVKSEHSYSIRKSDEEALKAAIAEIGLNVAVTKRPKLRIHFKKKTVVVLLVLTFAIGCGTAWRVNNANNEKIRAQKENAVNTIIEITGTDITALNENVVKLCFHNSKIQNICTKYIPIEQFAIFLIRRDGSVTSRLRKHV